MQSGITVCRTAIAHAALLALCGAAHAQQATTTATTAPTAPTAPAAEKALAPVTVSAGAEQESPTAPVTGVNVGGGQIALEVSLAVEQQMIEQ